MPYTNIPFKSYCWSLGTTSFRTKQFNQKIELQLKLLKEFFEIPEHNNVSWQGNNLLQIKYYEFLKEKEFLTGNESRPDKFAREKTSGLCELGLINENRRLTPVGEELLNISLNCSPISGTGYAIIVKLVSSLFKNSLDKIAALV